MIPDSVNSHGKQWFWANLKRNYYAVVPSLLTIPLSPQPIVSMGEFQSLPGHSVK